MDLVLFKVFLSEIFGSYFILIVDSCGGKFANGILNVTTTSHSNINKKFITRLSIPN